MKLYELALSYLEVQNLIEEGASIEAVQDTLEAISEAIEVKAENVAKLIKSIDAECEVIKVEEKRLADKRRALENKQKHLKQYVQQQLELAGIKKVKSPLFTISIQKNPASCYIPDETLISDEYKIPQPPKVDKDTIKKLLNDGKVVEGAGLKQTESLRIR